MKNAVFLIVAVALSNLVAAQKSSSEHMKVYHNAMQSGDAQMAITALSYVVAEQPKTTYRDTLAMLYYQSRQLAPALYWVEQRLAEKPANVSALKELQAKCFSAAGDTRASIKVWEELATATPDKPAYLWQLANGQFAIKRQLEALATIEKLETLKGDTAKVVNYTDGKQEALRFTSIPAAAANMKGMLLYEMKKLPEAKEAFAKAVTLDKSYALAVQNKSVVETELAAEEEKSKKAAANEAAPKAEAAPAKTSPLAEKAEVKKK